jgi:hypothetical protein
MFTKPSPTLILTALLVTIATAPALDLGKIGVKQGKDGGKQFNFAAPPADQSAEFVHKTSERSLKDLKKVAIVNFLVEFTTVREAKVMSSRPGVQSTSWASFNVPDPDVTRYQKIADALYDRLVADLTTAGIEVIPHDTLKAEKKFQDFKKVQHDSPWVTSTKGGSSVFIGGKGMPIYMDNPERANALKGMGLSLGMMLGANPTLLEVKLSQELKANLLSVNLVVDFADMKTKKFLGTTGIETTYDQFLHGDNTRFRFTGIGSPNGPALRLKHGMLAEHSPFMNFKQGKWEIQGDLIDRLASDTVTKTRSLSYDFSPETYYSNAERLGTAAQAMFLAEICKARGVALPASATTPVP